MEVWVECFALWDTVICLMRSVCMLHMIQVICVLHAYTTSAYSAQYALHYAKTVWWYAIQTQLLIMWPYNKSAWIYAVSSGYYSRTWTILSLWRCVCVNWVWLISWWGVYRPPSPGGAPVSMRHDTHTHTHTHTHSTPSSHYSDSHLQRCMQN